MHKIKGLDSNNQVWVDYWQLDSFDSEAYDEYKYESESSTFNSYIYYKESMSKVMILLSAKIDDSSLLEIFHRQIYVSVISYFETFLWLTVVNLTKANPLFLGKIVDNHPLFQQKEYLKKSKQQKVEIVKTLINSIPYSDLENKVRKLYKSAFDVEIPKDDKLTKHFKDTRNHVIHRSGYNKQGDKIEIDTMIIKDLMECCDTFVDNIAKKLHIDT